MTTVGARRRARARPGAAGAAAQGVRLGEAAARAHRGRARRDPVAARSRSAHAVYAQLHGAASGVTKQTASTSPSSPACRAPGGRRRPTCSKTSASSSSTTCRPRSSRTSPSSRSDRKEPQRFALVVDVRSGEFVARARSRARAAPRARRAARACCSSTRPTTCSCGATTPPGASTRSRAEDRVLRRHRAGAPPARGPQGRGRRRRRHLRPQRARAARPAPRAVRRRRPTEASLQTSVVSFGYKHGLPVDVDLVFDCRFLPNPHWVDELRPLPGTDPRCATTCCAHRRRAQFLDELRAAVARCCSPRTCARARRTSRSGSGAPAAGTAASSSPPSSPPPASASGYPPSVHHRDLDRE